MNSPPVRRFQWMKPIVSFGFSDLYQRVAGVSTGGADDPGMRRGRALGLLEQRLAPAQAGGDADHLGELTAGRRVGGEEAGGAGEDQGALLGPGRPGVELADGGLVGLEPVELGVLGEQRVAERGDGLAGSPPSDR